jgi:site-specific DNA recombinase
MGRLANTTARRDQAVTERLTIVAREIDNLAANMLAAVASPVLLKLLAKRESEKARLEGQLVASTTVVTSATILPNPALLQLFEEKVSRLRETLDADTVRGEAAEVLATLIESVTIYPEGPRGPEAGGGEGIGSAGLGHKRRRRPEGRRQ